MNFEKPKNQNYCAIVCELNNFVSLSNCDNVKGALILGNQVIVSKDTQPGTVGVYFPVETQLDERVLSNNNLYNKAEFGNIDSTKKGFFEKHGRVKCVKFRGHKSEGFFLPLSAFAFAGAKPEDFTIGLEFDKIGEYEICRKYVAKRNPASTKQKSIKQPRLEDRIVPNQFRFHPDTENLRRNIHKITPDMMVSISDKWHGTSIVISNIIVKRKLNIIERALQWLGVNIKDTKYGYTWSSRKVVKAVDGDVKVDANHYYDEDIWTVVAKEICPVLPKGFTVYAEIVGYTTTGSAIQSLGGKPYAYGCNPGEHRTLVYRVTSTNEDGNVIELSWAQMKQFCQKYGLEVVKELYCGPVSILRPFYADQDLYTWQQNLLSGLESQYVHDQDCPYNQGLPAEGIVLKVDDMEDPIAFKLKNFRFLKGESDDLDKGVVDLETEQSDDES